METRRSYKYRIYPTKAQITQLDRWMECCRYVYNCALVQRMNQYKYDGKRVTCFDQSAMLPELKQRVPAFKEVPAQIYQDVLARLDKAYKAFFARCKRGETPGHPKYKPYGQWSSVVQPQYYRHVKRYTDAFDRGMLYVPGLGDVTTKLHRPLPKNKPFVYGRTPKNPTGWITASMPDPSNRTCILKTLTISREGEKWFAIISLAKYLKPKQDDVTHAIGIDLGVRDFIYDSDGGHMAMPRYYRQAQKRLKQLQQRVQKAPKGSDKRAKLLKALQRTHYKIRSQRNDFHHKIALDLIRKNNVICYEDLTVKNMTRRPKAKQDPENDKNFLPNGASQKSGLNKSILDAGWSGFINILKYKAEEYGRTLVAVPPHYTSQLCSNCGTMVHKDLSTRTHECPDCGYVANRDHNAAKVILGRGLASLPN